MPDWPHNKPLAVCVNIMCEMWTDDAAPGVGPMGNPLAKGHLDTQARSWAEYGMTTGGYRLLDVVGDMDIPCGTYASGIITEKYPELLKRIDADGHFIAAHSWAQNILPVTRTLRRGSGSYPRRREVQIRTRQTAARLLARAARLTPTRLSC